MMGAPTARARDLLIFVSGSATFFRVKTDFAFILRIPGNLLWLFNNLFLVSQSNLIVNYLLHGQTATSPKPEFAAALLVDFQALRNTTDTFALMEQVPIDSVFLSVASANFPAASSPIPGACKLSIHIHSISFLMLMSKSFFF